MNTTIKSGLYCLRFIGVQLLMSNGEREVIFTLEKIFNWEPSSDSTHLTLAFYSLKTSALILQRTLTTTPIATNSELPLNYSLRITYLSVDNEVVLKLSHLAGRKGNFCLAEIMINLDSLTSRKVQFFPFGNIDKVLKIVVGESQQIPHCPLPRAKKQASNENQIFLKEKQDFLQRVIKGTSVLSARRNQSRPKKMSFSERARELLGDVQGLKGEIERGRKKEVGKSIEQGFNDYYQKPTVYHTQQDFIVISKHEVSKLTLANSESGHRFHSRQKTMTKENDSDRNSNRSQKHRLQLNNLQMVVVQNEYYDGLPEVRKLKRRSQLQGQNNYFSREKLQRHSQYY